MWPKRDHAKKRSSPPLFLKKWLNFRVRGQFEIKILTVRGHSDINTTYFIWILKKIKLEPTITWKLLTCQRITSKNTWLRWVDTWARNTVRWYWSADTLFWQLSIDHNIDVQSVFSWAPKLARKCESSKHWFPCGEGGRSVVRCTVTWLPNFLGWIDFLSYGAPRTRARGAPLQSLMSCILPTMHCRSQHCWGLLHPFARISPYFSVSPWPSWPGYRRSPF